MSLIGAKAKLSRARAHVVALDAEMDRFMKEHNPHEVITDVDSATGHLSCKIRVYQQPPLEWSLFIGDALQNVRAALDYLACELTLLNLGPTADLDRREFPIFTDPARFEAALGRKVGGVTPTQRVLLERAQPYTRRDPSQYDQLEILHRLAKVDKHRTLALAWVSLRQLSFPKTIALVGDARLGPLRDGAELARFRVVPPAQDHKARIDFAFGVTLAEGGGPAANFAIRPLLGAVHDRAADILGAFGQFFPE